MTTYLNSQLALSGLTLRARQSATLPSVRRQEFANAHLNPMIAKSIAWREMGMVCGQGTTVQIPAIGHTDVTDHKFSTRVGPGSASPPV
jgi:hypothetical protein